MAELIYRQAAIDALGERPIVWSNDDEYALGERNQYDIDRLAIETVPSAQPAQIQKDLTEYTHNEWVEGFMKLYGLSRQSAEDIMTIIPIIARLKRDEEKEEV